MKHTRAIAHQFQIHLFLFFASLLLIIIPVMNKTPSSEVAEQSLHAAAQFLFLVDTEEYAKSWEVTSSTLKDMLSQEAWNEKIEELRSFLGPVISRVQKNVTYTDSASDVPDGEYVVMTFISKFELREQVIETITLMLNDSDQWKVVGYFLKQV